MNLFMKRAEKDRPSCWDKLRMAFPPLQEGFLLLLGELTHCTLVNFIESLKQFLRTGLLVL